MENRSKLERAAMISSMVSALIIIALLFFISAMLATVSKRLPVYINRDKAEVTSVTKDVEETKADLSNIEDRIKRKNNSDARIKDLTFTSVIRIDTPYKSYEFTDMKIKCNSFAMDNNLFYDRAVAPYISPGVEYDIYLRCDKEDYHWIKMHVVNTEDEDICNADCKCFTVGINMIEGYSINGISVGDNINDIIKDIGAPDDFSLSDHNIISGATWDYGDYEINVRCDTLRGEVEYVEAVCKSTGGYSNGRWK